MDDAIIEILDTSFVTALADATGATIQLVRYELGTGSAILSGEITLTTDDGDEVKDLFLDPKTYWFGFKRCASLDVAKVRFAPSGLTVLIDFRCNNATFILGQNRVRAFFDHRREDLVLLVNHYFPDETSLDVATVVKKEFLHKK
jgi:hypothetical protein